MASDQLDEEVLRFLQRYIHNHEELHSLLLLNRERVRPWTLDQLASTMNEPRESVLRALLALEERGLVTGIAGDQLEVGVLDAQTAGSVEMLARAYSSVPLAVVQALSEQAIVRMRRSVDTFARGMRGGRGSKEDR